MRETTTTRTERGVGLARGPALVIGAILTAIGLTLFLQNGATPTGGFPNGDINGPTFFGVETNGWTAWLTTASGALLLFGAAQHLLAKAMSLIVGVALLAAAALALIDGDVLGLAAANNWTTLGWGVAGVLLLLNLFAPRTRKRDRVEEVHVDERREAPVARERVVTDVPATDGRVVRGEDQTVTRVERPLAGEDLERGTVPVRTGGGVVTDEHAVTRGPGRFRRH